MKKTNKYDAIVDLDSLQETALDYAEAGFRVMRLHGITADGKCACGWKLCNNAGKHPSTKGWSEIGITSEETIEGWFSNNAVSHGLGIVLDDTTLIVDVDEKNGGIDSLSLLERDIGATLKSTSSLIVDSGSGNGSRHYWFSKPSGVSIKKQVKEYKGIDFLSKGSYVVMPYSAHKSGGRYEFSSKTKSDPKAINKAPTELVQIIERKYTAGENSSQPGSCDVAELREALTAIPNNAETGYDEVWLPIGMALHHESSGDEYGFQLWLEWSEKGPKHDDMQMRYKWDSFATGGFNGSGYTGGTIFAMAYEHGWERDYSSLVDLSPFLERMKSGDVQQFEIVKNNVTYKNDSLPEKLKRAPGVVGLITDYIMSQAPKPLYLPSLTAAISYCGVTLGRDYKTTQDNYSSLYFIVTAPTGAGKEKPRSVIKDLLLATGQRKTVMNAPTSKGAISTALIESPRVVFNIDEMGHFIESGNGRNASQNKIDVRSGLMEIFANCNSSYLPEKYSRMTEYKHGVGEDDDEVDLTVNRPSVSIYGVTTPAKLTESITRMLIQDGFINRFIIVQAHEGRQKRQNIIKRPVPQSVLNWTDTVLQRSTAGGNLGVAVKDKYNIAGKEVELDMSDAATDVISEFEDYVLDKQKHLGMRGLDDLYSRCEEQAMRLSLVMELSSRPHSTEVQKDSAEFAVEFVKYNITQFEKLVEFELVESKQEGLYRDALKTINKAKDKGISKSELFKLSPFKSMRSGEKKEVLLHLLDTEQIFCESIQTGGAPKSVYYGSQFVRVK